MKKNKSGISEIKNLIKESKVEDKSIEYTYGDSKLTITIKPHLTLSEYSNLVSTIAESVFTTDKYGAIKYNPYLTRVAEAYAVLVYYTNLTEKIDAELVWELCTRTDLIDKVVEQIDQKELSMAYYDARELIQFKKEESYKKSGLAGALENLLKTINEKVLEEIDWSSVKSVIEKLGKLPEIDSADLVKEILNNRKENNESDEGGVSGYSKVLPE